MGTGAHESERNKILLRIFLDHCLTRVMRSLAASLTLQFQNDHYPETFNYLGSLGEFIFVSRHKYDFRGYEHCKELQIIELPLFYNDSNLSLRWLKPPSGFRAISKRLGWAWIMQTESGSEMDRRYKAIKCRALVRSYRETKAVVTTST
jgi:hypothetical protein